MKRPLSDRILSPLVWLGLVAWGVFVVLWNAVQLVVDWLRRLV